MVTKEKKKEYNKKYQDKIKEKLRTSSDLSSETNEEKEHVATPITPQKDFFFQHNLLQKVKEQAIMTSIPILMGIVYKTGYIIFQKMLQKQSQREQLTEPQIQSQPEYTNFVKF